MPYIKGKATSYEDLIAQIVAWATDETIHGEDAWELMRSEPWPRGTILKARGLQNHDHAYIGLMTFAINKDSSYANWYFTLENFLKYFIWSPDGLNLSFHSQFNVSWNTVSVPVSKDKMDVYEVDHANIFANDCKALVLGVFKQYSAGLNWDEQPGGLTIDVKETGLKQGVLYKNGEKQRRFPLPLYPGTGYPGIGMNPEEPKDGYFDFWLTKDGSHLTVVTRNRAVFPDQDYWDMAHVGMLNPYHAKMQYPFPAVIAGSSSGAISVGRMEYIFGREVIIDVQIDYGRHHWMMTRGMPTFPTIAADVINSPSQIVLCLPDGTWQYFANQVQQIEPFTPRGETDPLFIIGRPHTSAASRHFMLPTYSDLRGTTHVYQQPEETGKTLYQLETLKLVQNASDRKNMLGYFSNIYWPSIPVQQYGEIVINGKKHLMLPNCWEDRRWYYRTGLLGEYLPNDLVAQEMEIAQMTKQTNCLIRLED